MSTGALPLFPLNTVLFPGGPLSLRIFEPRYLDMVRRCLKERGGFGVVLILEGLEAGVVGRVADTGTSARIVDFDTLPDGLLGIVCVGERLEEREAGRTEEILARQCNRGILGLTLEQFARIVIAYEPVWAIGTGRTATPEIAAELVHFI